MSTPDEGWRGVAGGHRRYRGYCNGYAAEAGPATDPDSIIRNLAYLICGVRVVGTGPRPIRGDSAGNLRGATGAGPRIGGYAPASSGAFTPAGRFQLTVDPAAK